MLFLDKIINKSSVSSVPLKLRDYNSYIFPLKKYLEKPKGVKLIHPERLI